MKYSTCSSSQPAPVPLVLGYLQPAPPHRVHPPLVTHRQEPPAVQVLNHSSLTHYLPIKSAAIATIFVRRLHFPLLLQNRFSIFTNTDFCFLYFRHISFIYLVSLPPILISTCLGFTRLTLTKGWSKNPQEKDKDNADHDPLHTLYLHQ